MQSHTHVYLGPTLDLGTARLLLPKAHFHPPIQCGDIIRLLRLEPRKIIIIDGLYERVPAVWHKEILLAMELGVEVWGSASMGALRAAELNHFGMHGFGQIYSDFKAGLLNDDDEVAVLHRSRDEDYLPINDSMVNIRATCEQAFSLSVISLRERKDLIDFCKAQFYPYRVLKQAIEHFSTEKDSAYQDFSKWLELNGMIDVKKKDAMAVLQYHSQLDLNLPREKAICKTPMSIFIKELLYYAHLTPFTHEALWLPKIEQQLQALNLQEPTHYMLVAEIAFFTKKLFLYKPVETESISHQVVLDYIATQNLYSPEEDFKAYKNHPRLHSVYLLICQSVCLGHISLQLIDDFLPAIAHYYDIDIHTELQYQKSLRCLLVVILATSTQKNTADLTLSSIALTHHFNKIARERNYNKMKLNNWYHPTHFNVTFFRKFTNLYLKILQGQPTSHNDAHFYFKWIYDAYALCFTDHHAPAIWI